MSERFHVKKMMKIRKVFAIIRLVLIATVVVLLLVPARASAQETAPADRGNADFFKFMAGALAACIAVSLGSLAAGKAVEKVATASIGAIVEKPELFGRTILYVGLAEGIAIYGTIIALLIVFKI